MGKYKRRSLYKKNQVKHLRKNKDWKKRRRSQVGHSTKELLGSII